MLRPIARNLWFHAQEPGGFLTVYRHIGSAHKHSDAATPSTQQLLPVMEEMKRVRQPLKTEPPKGDGRDDNSTFMQAVVKYVETSTYMDQVRRSQQIVMNKKNDLIRTGEEKRSLMRKLDNVRYELSHIYKDMKINRSKEMYEEYLELTRKEIKLCELEKEYAEQYRLLDVEEQRLFAEFTTAINDSYEKEKLHTNFIKVVSIIGTVASSIISLVLYILYHTFQKNRNMNMDPIYDDLRTMGKKLATIEHSLKKKSDEKESWGSYLHRHTKWTYSWALKSR